jgi:hypothetical protein
MKLFSNMIGWDMSWTVTSVNISRWEIPTWAEGFANHLRNDTNVLGLTMRLVFSIIC